MSTTRIKKRIERDKIRRAEKNRKFMEPYDDFDNVITYQNYYKALQSCNKSVGYKLSVQEFNQSAITEIHKIIGTIKNGELPALSQLRKVTIRERGKERVITPIRIGDRITQKVICNNCLTDSIQRHLIYDNGASTKGKGTGFVLNRLDHMLRKAVKQYGSEFYVLKYDFKGFFDNIPHWLCNEILSETFTDRRIPEFMMDIIKSYPLYEAAHIEDPEKRNAAIESLLSDSGKGLCLGSQISQTMALVVPNALDHFIKDEKHMKYYVRYMDDGIILSDNKDELWELLAEMREIVEGLGLRFNDKKTYITKSTKGFTFMKIRHYISKENGKVVKKLDHDGVARMRRKLKSFRLLVDSGKMSLDDVYTAMQSWLDHAKLAYSYKTVKNMLKLYDKLFDGYKITRHWKHKQACSSRRTKKTHGGV